MADYEGMEEPQLRELLEKASNYDERSSIRKAIRKLKGGDSKKKTGTANYRRAGYQAPTTMAIPNSVTGNILPNKVSTENIHKVEVPNSKGPTISYLKSRSSTSRADSAAGSSGGKLSTSSAASPRGSVSSCTSDLSGRNDHGEDAEGGRTPSPHRVNGVASPAVPPTFKDPTPPPRDPTPEPPREPTPPPPKEPTPPPPKEPTPPPPREPTPPPKEPTPPPKEPTPPPPREPTPEEEPEVEEEVEEEVEVKVEEEEEAEEEEEEEEEEEDEPLEKYAEGVKVNYDSDEDQENRSFSPSQYREYKATRSAGGGAPSKTGVPLEIMTKKEEGVDGGDFRQKLQKANNTKIDTTREFPQAKPKGEQVDFRNVLKKKEVAAAKVDTSAAFPQAKPKGEQVDFRNVLRKAEKKEPAPAPKSSRSRRHEADEEEETKEEERQNTPEDVEEGNQEQEDEAQEEEEDELRASKEEEEEQQQEEEEKEEAPQEQEAVDSPSPSSATDKGSAEVEEDSYEARQAERKRRREQRQRELAAITDDKPASTEDKPASTEESSTSSASSTSGAGEPDTYEARREARRKAREERLKAASARDKPSKMSYKDKKALEAKKNAMDSRSKWENREEDSGAKSAAKPVSFKKKDSATQQLLAWCQHKTKYYENVEIKDFKSSWSDGLAFCAIIHSFLPDKIPYDELTPEDKRKNFTLAFEAAKEAGIPEMLDVDDMLMVKVPDAKSIMTFLVTIYQHFNS